MKDREKQSAAEELGQAARRPGEAMQAFRDLGGWLQARWRERHFDERVFPELSLAALESFPPCQRATYADVIRAWVFENDLPRNISVKDFGEPSITVYSAERFFIEVLCWMEGTTALHQHSFSGAFHVMEGASVHSTYRFETRERIDAQMRLGRLVFQATELLKKGDSRPIRAGEDFIHALFHLERPSISVVVRTHREADRLPQWSYMKPHLALDPFHHEADRRQRLSQTLNMLLRTDRETYVRLVERIAAESDLSLVYAALDHGFLAASSPPYSLDEEQLAALHAAVRARFGRTGDELIASCRHDHLARDLGRRREEVHDRDLRLFLALLMNVPTQRDLLGLIERQFEGDPRLLVQRWLRELTERNGPCSIQLLDVAIDIDDPLPEIELDELLYRIIAAMMDGAGDTALRDAIAASWTLPRDEPLLDSVLEIEARLRDSSLRPLFAPQAPVRQNAAQWTGRANERASGS